MRQTNTLIFIPDNVNYVISNIFPVSDVSGDNIQDVSRMSNPLKREDIRHADSKKIKIRSRKRKLEIVKEEAPSPLVQFNRRKDIQHQPTGVEASEVTQQIEKSQLEVGNKTWIVNNTDGQIIVSFGSEKNIHLKPHGVFDSKKLTDDEREDPYLLILFDGEYPQCSWVNGHAAKDIMIANQKSKEINDDQLQRMRAQASFERGNRINQNRDVRTGIVKIGMSGGGIDMGDVSSVGAAAAAEMGGVVGSSITETIDMTSDYQNKTPNTGLSSEISSVFNVSGPEGLDNVLQSMPEQKEAPIKRTERPGLNIIE